MPPPSSPSLTPRPAKPTPLGKPAVFQSCSPSPDGRYFLVVKIHRPYSYVLPLSAFPKKVEVWDAAGKVVHTLADLPLADRVPIEGVPTGPRGHHWRPTAPATWSGSTALDGGDPRKKAAHRDQVFCQPAPFDKAAQKPWRRPNIASSAWRGPKKAWPCWRTTTASAAAGGRYLLQPDRPDAPPRLLWDRAIQDRYRDPGDAALAPPAGRGDRPAQHGSDIFLVGDGRLAEGKPAIPRSLQPRNREGDTRSFSPRRTVLNRSIDVLADDGSRFLTRHESASVAAELSRSHRGQGSLHQPDELHRSGPRAAARSRERWSRTSAPTACRCRSRSICRRTTSRERACRRCCGPIRASSPIRRWPGRWSARPRASRRWPAHSHLFFLLAGYAVLDGATMPVVGPPEKANDTFVEQIVASAKAAIDKAVELGVTDRDRVGVGGHSYGAFMTANLLAHSRPVPRRHRPQRRVQPHADAVRLPERAADALAGAGSVLQGVAAAARRQDQGAAPADPRREGQQFRHVPDAERAAVPGHSRQRRHGAATCCCRTNRTATPPGSRSSTPWRR